MIYYIRSELVTIDSVILYLIGRNILVRTSKDSGEHLKRLKFQIIEIGRWKQRAMHVRVSLKCRKTVSHGINW